MKVRNLTEYSIRITAGDRAIAIPRWGIVDVPDDFVNSENLKVNIKAGYLVIIEPAQPVSIDKGDSSEKNEEESDDKKPKRTRRSSSE